MGGTTFLLWGKAEKIVTGFDYPLYCIKITYYVLEDLLNGVVTLLCPPASNGFDQILLDFTAKILEIFQTSSSTVTVELNIRHSVL